MKPSEREGRAMVRKPISASGLSSVGWAKRAKPTQPATEGVGQLPPQPHQPLRLSTLLVCQLWLTPAESRLFSHLLLKYGFCSVNKSCHWGRAIPLSSCAKSHTNQGFTRSAAGMAQALLSLKQWQPGHGKSPT